MAKAKNPKRDEFFSLLKKHKVKKHIIDAFGEVDQERFFDPMFRAQMYTPEAVPIGFGERSDPPLALAQMLSRLGFLSRWRVLEVGTGSGYSTAVLSHLAREVVTVEFKEDLAAFSKRRMKTADIENVRVFAGDGTEYDASLGTFDAVIVLAACRKRPLTLLRSLKEGGKLIFPMGPEHQQQITLLVNETVNDSEDVFRTSFHEFCEFTPIEGKYGWS